MIVQPVVEPMDRFTDLCGQCDEPGHVAGPGAVSGDPGVGGVEAGADPAPPHLHPVHHAPLLLRQDLRQDVLNIEGTQLGLLTTVINAQYSGRMSDYLSGYVTLHCHRC